MRERVTHDLKVWPEFFAALASGRKTFELRKNDRDFQEGDTLLLREWNFGGGYTGAKIEAAISYKLEGFTGIEPGYAILGLSGDRSHWERPSGRAHEGE